MSYLDDVYEREDVERKENAEKNMKYFNSLTSDERLKLMWGDYISKHRNDLGVRR